MTGQNVAFVDFSVKGMFKLFFALAALILVFFMAKAAVGWVAAKVPALDRATGGAAAAGAPSMSREHPALASVN